MRLATSSRNGLTSPSTILNGTAQPGYLLEVAFGEVRSFQLLLPQLGQRMQAAAEQRSHLLRGHRVADWQTVDPVQAGADPDAWCLTPLDVVRRQPGVTLLDRVQGSHLAGQIVIPRSRCELVDAHRHTRLKGVHAARAITPTRPTSGSGPLCGKSFGGTHFDGDALAV
jgi:hypothetical protein